MNPFAFVIARFLQAPRAAVWQAYTEAAHLRHWFAPQGVTMVHSAMDFRPGGRFHYNQAMDSGVTVWGLWHFRAIQEPEQIVLMQHFSDADAAIVRNPWNAGWPLQTLSTTTFAEHEGGTLLSIRWEPHAASAAEEACFLEGHASMRPGWSSVLDRLEAYLALPPSP